MASGGEKRLKGGLKRRMNKQRQQSGDRFAPRPKRGKLSVDAGFAEDMKLSKQAKRREHSSFSGQFVRSKQTKRGTKVGGKFSKGGTGGKVFRKKAGHA